MHPYTLSEEQTASLTQGLLFFGLCFFSFPIVANWGSDTRWSLDTGSVGHRGPLQSTGQLTWCSRWTLPIAANKLKTLFNHLNFIFFFLFLIIKPYHQGIFLYNEKPGDGFSFNNFQMRAVGNGLGTYCKKMCHVEVDENSVKTRSAKHNASFGLAKRIAALMQRQRQVFQSASLIHII